MDQVLGGHRASPGRPGQAVTFFFFIFCHAGLFVGGVLLACSFPFDDVAQADL